MRTTKSSIRTIFQTTILEGCFSFGWQLAISDLKMSNLKLKGKMIMAKGGNKKEYTDA